VIKVAVVGGGSTYTPELVDGIARLGDALPIGELALYDPDPDRLDAVGGISRRIFDRQAWPGLLTPTTDLAEALDAADFVLIQLRVGGQAARHRDETIPLRCGCVGQETTGAGGFAKALRTVPVVLDLAEEIRRRSADDAWIVDFTNPVGIVTRALLDAGHRAVGLCNVAIGFQRLIAGWLDVAPDEVQLGHVGLNHLTWIGSVMVDGSDVLPELMQKKTEELAEHLELPAGLLARLGCIPSYYLRYFYLHDVVVDELRTQVSRASEVAAIERTLLAQYRDPSVNVKPELLARRGGAFYSEAALDLVRALWADTGTVQVVDVRNDGALPGVPDDAVIEVPCHIGRRGATPVGLSGLPPDQAGLVAHVAAYERLTVQAALTGDVDVAFLALLSHPLIGQAAPAEQLLHDLLDADREHLPRFAP